MFLFGGVPLLFGVRRLAVLRARFVISPGLMQKAYGAGKAAARDVRGGIGMQAGSRSRCRVAPTVSAWRARATPPRIHKPDHSAPNRAGNSCRRALARLRWRVFSGRVSTLRRGFSCSFGSPPSLSRISYKASSGPTLDDFS